MKATAVALIVAVALAGATALAADRHPAGLKQLGLKAYWSLLDEGQKEEAKGIFAEHLAATAPDRLAAFARLVRFKADVAAVLTPEQRLGAVRLRGALKRLPKQRKAEILDALLAGTDRMALAGRIEDLSAAAPADQVRIGLEILDQMYEVLEPKLAEKLALASEQRAKIRALYGDLKTDLEPLAARLAEARSLAIRKGLAILSEEQRSKLEELKERVLERVTDFIRG